MNDTDSLFDQIQNLGDEVLCWVELTDQRLCIDKIAEWRIMNRPGHFYLTCDGCKRRFDSFGSVLEAYRL